MSNILGIFTFVVLLASGFVAYKNKEAYAEEITTAQRAASNLDSTNKRLAKAIDEKEQTISEREALEGEVAKLNEDVDTQKKSNADLKSLVDAKTSKIETNKAKLDTVREEVSKVGNIDELADKVKTLNADIEELTLSIAGKEASLANLTAENKSVSASNSTIKQRLEDLRNSRSVTGLKTSIRSIYPTWGFVTLNAGNNSGVATGSTLDVIRDGATVGKLLVTSVESSTASASIIPDSVEDDSALMVGDQVVPGAPDGPTRDDSNAN